MRIIVLGGAGDMGSRAVRDLAEQPEVQALIIGDYDQAKAQAATTSRCATITMQPRQCWS